MPVTHLRLQQTEGFIIEAAAQIYAALVISGQCTPDNDKEMTEKAIVKAIQMAKTIDVNIVAEGEMGTK